MPRRLAVLTFVAALAASLVALPAASSSTVAAPSLAVGGDYAFLNDANNLWFWLRSLQREGPAASVAITVPEGFTAALRSPAGTRLGGATLVAIPHRGATVSYSGQLVVTSAPVLAADRRRAGCAQTAHLAAWRLVLAAKGGTSLDLPIGVARTAAGTRLDLCLAGLAAAGLRPSSVYFQTNRTFHNPADTSTYRFGAEVTGAGSGKSYSMVADDPVPQQLFVEAGHASSGALTVKGALRGGGYPRRGVTVKIYGGVGTDSSKWHFLGAARTRADGSYHLVRSAKGVNYIYAFVDLSLAKRCGGVPAPPARCLSSSVTGIASPEAAVSTSPPAPA
jgi:hypothetical protein